MIALTKSFYDSYVEKAGIKNRSHLVRKQVTDKNGHNRTVWVNPEVTNRKQKTRSDKNNKAMEKIFNNVFGCKVTSIRNNELPDDKVFFIVDVDFNSMKNGKNGVVAELKESLKKNGYEPIDDISRHLWNDTRLEYQFTVKVNKPEKTQKKKEFKPEPFNPKQLASKQLLQSLQNNYFNVNPSLSYKFKEKDGKIVLSQSSPYDFKPLPDAADVNIGKDGSIELHGYKTYARVVADGKGTYAKKNGLLREITVKINPEEIRRNLDDDTFLNKLKDFSEGFSYNKDFTIKKV